MVKKALIIGINYIGTDDALQGCINDALNIKSFLAREFHVTGSSVRLMTEAGSPSFQPTHANILNQIRWLVEGATSESQLFIHFAGHGTQIYDRNNDENDRRDECICPLDYKTAGLITDDVLRARLVNVLPRGARLFGLFDCCHSGTILDLKYNYLFHKDQSNNDSYQTQIERRARVCRAKVTLISGCLDHQTSADAYINNKAQGAMTHSFLCSYDLLKKKGKPLTCRHLMKELHKKILEGEFSQRPKLSTGSHVSLMRRLRIFD